MKRSICLASVHGLLFFHLNVPAQVEVAPGVVLLGHIQHPEITESSGVVASKGGVLWTHNDSGQDILYAITRDGEPLAEWKIKDTELQNWEDTASAPGRLYIADIGNNDGSRKEVFVYQIRAPGRRFSGEIRPTRVWRLEYPDGDEFDAESLIVSRGAGYIIAKELTGGEARVYRFPLRGKGAARELEPQCRLNVNAPVGGAAITPDGRRLAVITREGAYLFVFSDRRIPAEGKIEPALFVPFELDRMEGCTFTSDGLVVTAESGEILLFTDPQFQNGKSGKRKRR